MNTPTVSLFAETPVLTPRGYVNAEKLHPGETVYTTVGTSVTVDKIATYPPHDTGENINSDDDVDNVDTTSHAENSVYAVTLSTGETIFTTGEQKWQKRAKRGVSNDSTEEFVTSQQLHQDYKDPEHATVYFFAPDAVALNERPKFHKNLVGKNENLSMTSAGLGVSHCATVIARAYGDILCSVSYSCEKDNGENLEKAVATALDVVEEKYGSHVAEIFKGTDGFLPQWVFSLPLADRVNMAGIIIDNVPEYNFHQSHRSTYATLYFHPRFHNDMVSMLSGAGCTIEMDAIPYLDDNDESITVCVNKRVFGNSFALRTVGSGTPRAMSTGKLKDNSIIEVVSVEKITATDSNIPQSLMYSISVNKPQNGIVVGRTHIPMHFC